MSKLTRRQAMRSSLALGAAALVGGCGQEEPLLRVGSNTWLGYELLHVAEQQGVLDPARVRMVRMGSATLVVQALAAGQLEAAGLTLDEVLSAITDGIPLKVLAVVDFSQGADAVLARPGLASAADFKGRRVCVEKSAVGAVMLDAFLTQYGLAPTDLELHYATVDEHAGEFQSGHSDLVVTFSPVVEQLEKLGATRVFDSKQVPGRIVDVLVATEAALKRNPQALRQLVAAQFTMLARMRAAPAALAPLLAPGLGMAAEEIPAAYAGIEMPDLAENHRWLVGAPPPLLKSAQELQRIMIAATLLKSAAPLGRLIDPAYLAGGAR